MIALTLRLKDPSEIDRHQRALEIAIEGGTKAGLERALKRMRERAREIAEERIKERHGNIRDQSEGSGVPYVDAFAIDPPQGSPTTRIKGALRNRAPDAFIQEDGRKKNARRGIPLSVMERYLDKQGILPPNTNKALGNNKVTKNVYRKKKKGEPDQRYDRPKVKKGAARRRKRGFDVVKLGPLGTRRSPDRDKTREQVIFLAVRAHRRRGQKPHKIVHTLGKEFQNTDEGLVIIRREIGEWIQRTGAKLR